MASKLNRVFFGTTALVAVLLWTLPTADASEPRAEYHLKEQDLGTSLRAVSRTSGRQVIFESNVVIGKRAHALDGQFTTEEAIDQLLKDSPLVAIYRGGTILIRGRSDASDAAIAASADADILVTGSRIRGARVAAPVIEISQQDMHRAGQNDLGEVIRQLPQSFGGGQNPAVAPGTVGVSNQNLTGGSSANLRGLGADATLTLVNGHRLSYGSAIQAVDIGAIPVAAVEKIEVIADGASAIYGSDAVGGVVNILLKRDYEGLSTTARVGTSTDGGDSEQQYSVVAGHSWKSGGLILTFDHSRATELTSSQREYTRYMVSGNTLVPFRNNNSILGSAHQELSNHVEASVDVIYNHRTSASTLQLSQGSKYVNTPAEDSFAVAPSLKVALPAEWTATLNGVYGKDHTDYDQATYSGGAVASRAYGCYCNTIKSVELGAQGSLARLPAGNLRLAVGGGYRYNSFTYFAASSNSTIAKGATDSFYAFGEAYVPLASPAQQIGGLYRLAANAAVRYERYAGTAQVVTPKIGLIYAPTSDVDFKGSWGKSFKVPTLAQQYQQQSALLYPASLVGGAAGKTAILSSGGNPDLKPERADTWSVSVNLHPIETPRLQIEASYFHVRYIGRIIQPVSGINVYSALSNPAFAGYVSFAPSAGAQAAIIAGTGRPLSNYSGAAYDPANVAAIIYNNYINSAEQRIEGLDLMSRFQIPAGSAGDIFLQGNGSWLRSHEQVNKSAPATNLAGVMFNPPRFKARASIIWVRGGVSLAGYLNHSGALRDTRGVPAARIAPQTSIDLTMMYSFLPGSPLGALDLSLSARNLFNVRPPYAAPSGGFAYYVDYDSTNYSPVGRFLSFSVTKKW